MVHSLQRKTGHQLSIQVVFAYLPLKFLISLQLLNKRYYRRQAYFLVAKI